MMLMMMMLMLVVVMMMIMNNYELWITITVYISKLVFRNTDVYVDDDDHLNHLTATSLQVMGNV